MEEKKLHIIKNVGLLYLKFGIRAITMDDVAAEFGVSKKTLYQHFSDKRDLVTQVIQYFLDNPELDFRSKVTENAIDNVFVVRKHVAHVLKYYNNTIEFDLKKLYPDLYQKVREVKRQRIFDNSMENLKYGMEQGLYRKDLEPYFIAKLQVGRMLYTLNPDFKIFEDYEVHSVSFFDSIMNYHMHAICTEKGINYYKKQLNIAQNEDKN